METPICDLLTSVVGSEAHASSPSGKPGGEWDAWYALSRKSRRRLIGAGFARSGGLPPDVFADLIGRNRGELDDYREGLEWFYRTALAAIVERRAAANRDRHDRVAREAGHASYYFRRDAQARAAGYGSFWGYRQAMEWQEGRQPKWVPKHKRVV